MSPFRTGLFGKFDQNRLNPKKMIVVTCSSRTKMIIDRRPTEFPEQELVKLSF